MLRPLATAVAAGAVAEVQDDHVDVAAARAARRRARDVRVRGPVEAVAADAPRARDGVRVRARRQRGVERGVEDGDVRERPGTRAARPRSRPRWPGCAAARAPPGRGSRPPPRRRSAPAPRSARRRARRGARPPRRPSSGAAVQHLPTAPPRGRLDLLRPCPTRASRPKSASTTDHFSDEEPQLTTRTLTDAWIAVIATVLTMSCTVAPRERSLTGLLRPCSTGPMAIAFARALDGLVGVVAGVEVREDEDGRAARDLAARQLRCAPRRRRPPRRTGSGPRPTAPGRARARARSPRAPARPRRPTRTRRSSRRASPPAARCRTARRSRPRRSRCPPAARRVGFGLTAQSP